MKHLKEFLDSDLTVKVVPMEHDRYGRNTIYTKVPTVKPNLSYILVNEYTPGEFIPTDKFNGSCYAYKGLYDTNTKTFYVNYESNVVPGVNCIVLNKLNDVINAQVQQAMVDIVKNDINNLNLDEIPEIDTGNIKSKAKKLYIFNEYAKYNYATFYTDLVSNISALVGYIENENGFINEVAEWYIENESERIYRDIVVTNKINQEIKRLEDTQELEHLRKMSEILKDDTRKNYIVGYSIDGKDMTFKMSAHDLKVLLNGSCRMYWDIQNAKEQDMFRRNYRDSGSEILLEGIKSLKYGKKVLFSA